MSLAIDISNFTGEISDVQASALYDAGVGKVIVQLVSPDILVHRRQVPALLRAGLAIEFYVYVWFSAGEAFMQSRIAWACREADAFPGVTKTIWLDCEQSDGDIRPFDYVRMPVSPMIHTAVAAVRAGGYSPGIYTGEWWWTPATSHSQEWADLPLWDAYYDGDPALNPVLYGGWDVPAMKQYTTGVTLGGVPNVNLDAYESYTYPVPVVAPEPPAPVVPPPYVLPGVEREVIEAALYDLDLAKDHIRVAQEALRQGSVTD